MHIMIFIKMAALSFNHNINSPVRAGIFTVETKNYLVVRSPTIEQKTQACIYPLFILKKILKVVKTEDVHKDFSRLYGAWSLILHSAYSVTGESRDDERRECFNLICDIWRRKRNTVYDADICTKIDDILERAF